MIRYILFAICVSQLSGCSGIPEDAFLLSPSTPEDRRQESRVFPINDELVLLKDATTILENMGYTSDVVNADIGLITATKGGSKGGFSSSIISVLSAGLASPDNEQVYKATFTTRPSTDRKNAIVTRLTLQRMVLNTKGEATEVELIKDKDTYNLFYQRLEASTFIEPDYL